MADPLLAPAFLRISDAVEYADVLVLARSLVRDCADANRHESQRFVDGDVCVIHVQGLVEAVSIGVAGHGTVVTLSGVPVQNTLSLVPYICEGNALAARVPSKTGLISTNAAMSRVFSNTQISGHA